jgi:hypothetical protein
VVSTPISSVVPKLPLSFDHFLPLNDSRCTGFAHNFCLWDTSRKPLSAAKHSIAGFSASTTIIMPSFLPPTPPPTTHTVVVHQRFGRSPLEDSSYNYYTQDIFFSTCVSEQAIPMAKVLFQGMTMDELTKALECWSVPFVSSSVRQFVSSSVRQFVKVRQFVS